MSNTQVTTNTSTEPVDVSFDGSGRTGNDGRWYNHFTAWDIDLQAMMTDPLGLFGGGSTFNSTRYYYIYNQFSNEKENWMPDPIDTYAMSAIMQNQDIASHIISSIQQGSGNNLKRYYQYATRRFKHRNWRWELRKAKQVDRSILPITKTLLQTTLGLNNRFDISYEDTEYQEYGISYLAWIQSEYGLDEFNTNYQGKDYEIIQPPIQLSNGNFAIAGSNDGSYLEVQTIPVKPSKGVIYLSSSTTPIEKHREVSDVVLDSKQVPSNYPTQPNQVTWIKEESHYINPYEDEPENPVLRVSSEDYAVAGLVLVNYYIEFIKNEISGSILNRKSTFYFKQHKVISFLPYDKENFLYVEDDGSTNNQTFKSLVDIPQPQPIEPEQPLLNSNNSKKLKFYPFIPLREWLKGNSPKYYDFPEVPESLSKAIKKLNDITKELDKDKSDPNVDRNKRPDSQNNIDNLRNKTDDGESGRSLQRQVQRGIASKRKVKAKQLVNMAKPMSNKALKRHVNVMANLLGTDFDYEAGNFKASKQFDGTIQLDKNGNGDGRYYSYLLMPAVNFATNNKEAHRYLYTFFNRLYAMYGKEEQVVNWYNAVNQATSLSSLPINDLRWKNHSNMEWGGMSWFFISKFKMKGNVRKIRRNKRYYDILRGKPTTIKSIQDLKNQIEPLHELASDKFHTTKAGVQYALGGQGYNGDGVFDEGNQVYEGFKNYDYTFIAKQSGKDEITVLAVAGLSFSTKLSEQVKWSRAFNDLALHYNRNRKKYLSSNLEVDTVTKIERKQNKKKKHFNLISHWGILPLDYRSICRMGGTELERFAPRAVLTYGVHHYEQKGKRKGLKVVVKVVQAVILIIAIILAVKSVGTSVKAGVALSAAIGKAVGQFVLNMAIAYVAGKVAVGLIKLLGLKGFLAMIIMIAVIIAISYTTGSSPDTQSALPYASEVGAQTATEAAVNASGQAASQATSQAVTQSLGQVVQATFQSFTEGLLKGLTEASAFSVLSTSLDASFKAVNQEQAKQMASLEADYKADQERFEKTAKELREAQEELEKYKPQFDVNQVLSALRLRFKNYDPDTFLSLNTSPDEYSASYAYLENFIDVKLNLDPLTFDPVQSLDFGFKNTFNDKPFDVFRLNHQYT